MIPIKPKDVFWSDEQWQAIHESGKSILVNAGAGSGKTAVLTQRIIEILERGVSLDRLIVLTFTKAAASEMKERVRKELTKIVKTDAKYQKELDYIDQSAIQTFDAFALSLVKRYHYLLGINKSINIGDQVILSIKRKEIIDDVFNDLYVRGDKDFLSLVDMFSVKNDKLLQEYIFNIGEKIDLLANTEEYLEKYLNYFYNEEYIDKRIGEFTKLISFDIDRIKIRLNNISNLVSDDRLVKYYEDLQDSLTDLLASRTYKGYLENIEVAYPRLPGKGVDDDEKIKVEYEAIKIKDLVKGIKKRLIYKDESEIKEELLSSKKLAKVVLDILSEVNKRFTKYKQDVNLYGFLDVAKLAIKLFQNNADLKDYYKSNIYEILIDEYQDTSDIQEILISLISNNNVYMVGDIKQSIYRFRNANPDIFKDKYDLFKNSKDALAIDLSKNFRSRKEVLDNINNIFSKVMTLDLGGVDYNENHALKFGNIKYEENKPNSSYDVEILNYLVKEEEESGLTTSEKEAFIVARDIKEKLDSKYQIYDKDEKVVRDCTHSDFTILVSEKSKFELYKKIFEYLQLPLVIHKEEDFVRSNEVYVLKNILRAVYSLTDYEYYKDNFKDAIFSILRSFLVEADDEDISLIFVGDIKQGLNLRFPEIYSNLNNISRIVQKSTLNEILTEIYKIFDVYYKIVKLGNVEEVENKLNFLLGKFSELDKMGYGLKEAINYLEVLITEGYDIEVSSGTKIDNNAINIMSIHKSKGLEFSICYYVELASRFRMSENNDRIIFDKDFGLIFPAYKEGLRDTIYKSLLKNKYLIEEISERLRVFYVALTRAKEKMIIVCEEFTDTFDFYDETIPLVERLNYNSFYSILNSLKSPLRFYSRLVLHKGTMDYKKSRISEISSVKTPRIDVRYVSVEMEKLEKQIASSSSKNLLTKDQLESMEFGTLIHEYFELLDFKTDIKDQLKDINLSNKIKEKIEKFYNLPIFKENILNIYHEYQFSYTLDNIIYKGLIDLIVETDNKYIIIDYKLSNLDKDEYTKQLNVYYNYLKQITSKSIDAYLYSIINEELRLIIQGEKV